MPAVCCVYKGGRRAGDGDAAALRRLQAVDRADQRHQLAARAQRRAQRLDPQARRQVTWSRHPGGRQAGHVPAAGGERRWRHGRAEVHRTAAVCLQHQV